MLVEGERICSEACVKLQVQGPSLTHTHADSFSNNNPPNLLVEFPLSTPASTVTVNGLPLEHFDEKMQTNDVDDELIKRIYWNVKKFLGGQWQDLALSDIQVKTLSGGLSNYLYTCSLPPEKDPVAGEPKCVLIRIFGTLLQQEALIMDSVIFALLAEKGLGPRLHGVFPGGRIEEFIPSRCLTNNDLANSTISRRIAQLVGSFHSLNMPAKKDPDHLFDLSKRFGDDAIRDEPLASVSGDTLQRLDTLMTSINHTAELEWLRCTLQKVNSPIVFCHNDVQAGNLLRFNLADGQFELKMIDFEFASYGYRGFDLANHFCEWSYDNFYSKPPFFKHHPQTFPTREEQVAFVLTYLEASSVYDHHTEVRLLQEVEYFTLLSHLLWALWSASQVKLSTITFDYLAYAESRYQAYLVVKAQLARKSIQIFNE